MDIYAFMGNLNMHKYVQCPEYNKYPKQNMLYNLIYL